MSFELFTGKKSRYGSPKITINKAGQIGINPACLNMYFSKKKYVMVYLDKDNNKIGFKPADDDKNNAFKLTHTNSGNSASISGQSFLKFIHYDYKVNTKSFEPQWNEKEEILIIELK